jgi:glycosyltransferase involved in cell wall biosynthesis
VIPYGLNKSKFQSRDRTNARQLLGLSQDKNLILFGAVNATSDKRKGFDYFLPALRQLSIVKNSKQTEIVIFGASKPNAPDDLGMKINYLGQLHDELSLSLVYMASDVFVVPSREDNLPNTIMEALSSGTPCVAFKVGGIPEMIEHNISGYLAEPFDSADLARGIAWVIENKQRWRILSKAARKKAEDEYDINMVAKRYADLYQSVLHDRKLGKA